MKQPVMIPFDYSFSVDDSEMKKRSEVFFNLLSKRRTIRDFSDKPVPAEVILNCIKTAGTAPSGANKQPWHFVAVSDRLVKRKIRIAAEEEEHQFYTHRAPKEWLEALSPIGTDEKKPFLEKAPWLIAIFSKSYDLNENSKKIKNYYTTESTGIACGMLITALHNCGLVSLTHTPSPMNFLNEILSRPANEKPFLLLVTGYPAENATVPDLRRKELKEFVTVLE
ncbi:MAG: nitroreductase family protein [Ignavibacteriaceae bacterium]